MNNVATENRFAFLRDKEEYEKQVRQAILYAVRSLEAFGGMLEKCSSDTQNKVFQELEEARKRPKDAKVLRVLVRLQSRVEREIKYSSLADG